MNSLKIVKRNNDAALALPRSGQAVFSSQPDFRIVERIVKSWIAERNQRRRDEQLSHSLFRKTLVTLSLVFLSLTGFSAHIQGQQLREAFRSVHQAVAVVKTEQIGLAPFPQQGFTSSNGLGSGVLISNDGKVLTAAHLVQSADRTLVEFSQGEPISARVIGCALSADVALLQLEHTPSDLISAKLGDSDQVEVGDEIFVVGAPYGISRTLTAGHISGRRVLNWKADNATPVEFLQTDAAVNMGNSGSPVFNLKGEVVGIVSNIMSRSGGSEGLAFAASSNTARRSLLDQKTLWTGIDGVLIDGNLARALNLTQPSGVLVQRVAEGSLAARWGIRAGTVRANVEGNEIILGGDIILRVNGVSVDHYANYDEIYESFSRLKAGDNLVITVFREGQIVKLSIPRSE